MAKNSEIQTFAKYLTKNIFLRNTIFSLKIQFLVSSRIFVEKSEFSSKNRQIIDKD